MTRGVCLQWLTGTASWYHLAYPRTIERLWPPEQLRRKPRSGGGPKRRPRCRSLSACPVRRHGRSSAGDETIIKQECVVDVSELWSLCGESVAKVWRKCGES